MRVLRDDPRGVHADAGDLTLRSLDILDIDDAPREPRIVDPAFAAELVDVLTRFHRDVVIPDIERIVDARIDARITPFRDEVMTHFDTIDHRFDRLESETASLKSAVRRLEGWITPP